MDCGRWRGGQRPPFCEAPTLKPITLTIPGGGRPRINPLHIVSWAPVHIQVGDKTHLGAAIILADGGTRQVLENAEQIDWLFEQATAKVEQGDLMTALLTVLELRRVGT